jgi:hypothetical protein
MIERTTFDLRIADHTTATARINASDWQRQAKPKRRVVRTAFATALVALAARLDPAAPAAATPLLASGRGGA